MNITIDQLLEKFQLIATEYGINIVTAIIIIVVGRYAALLLKGVVKKAFTKSKVDPTVSSFISSVLYFSILCAITIAALGHVGIETTSFIAILGAAGLAIALAFKDSLSNFAASALILILRPYKSRDFIDAAGLQGTVSEISIFNTTIHTPDNKKIIIPNSAILAKAITNYSAEKTRRIDLVIGAAYTDDIDTVKNVLAEVVKGNEKVHAEPAPLIVVGELGDNSINYFVRIWVASPDFWATRYALLENIKKAFDANGISIPFPQSDVHIIKEE